MRVNEWGEDFVISMFLIKLVVRELILVIV